MDPRAESTRGLRFRLLADSFFTGYKSSFEYRRQPLDDILSSSGILSSLGWAGCHHLLSYIYEYMYITYMHVYTHI